MHTLKRYEITVGAEIDHLTDDDGASAKKKMVLCNKLMLGGFLATLAARFGDVLSNQNVFVWCFWGALFSDQIPIKLWGKRKDQLKVFIDS